MSRMQQGAAAAFAQPVGSYFPPAVPSTTVSNARDKHVLFVCRANRMRSPTAEAIYLATPGITAHSAGIADSAPIPVTPALLKWADIVFVMEPYMRDHLLHHFPILAGVIPILSLYIPAEYTYMDTQLIHLLTQGVSQIIGPPTSPES